MVFVTLVLLAIVAVASLVVAFVAYPQRGRVIPRAPRLSEALQGVVDSTGVDPHEDEAVGGGALTELRRQRGTTPVWEDPNP